MWLLLGFVPVSSGSGNKIEVKWTDRSRIEEGYFLERQIADPGGSSFESVTNPGDSQDDPGLPANTTSHEDEVDAFRSEIRYRVRAWNEYGYSDYAGPRSTLLPLMVRNDQPIELTLFADVLSDQEGDLEIDCLEVESDETEGESSERRRVPPVKSLLKPFSVQTVEAGGSSVTIEIHPKPNATTKREGQDDHDPIDVRIGRIRGGVPHEDLFLSLTILDPPEVSMPSVPEGIDLSDGIELEIEVVDRDSSPAELELDETGEWGEDPEASQASGKRRIRWTQGNGGPVDRVVTIGYRDDRNVLGSRSFRLVVLEEIQTVADLPVTLDLKAMAGLSLQGQLSRLTSSDPDLLPVGNVLSRGDRLDLTPVSEGTGYTVVSFVIENKDTEDFLVLVPLRIVNKLFFSGKLQGVESAPFVAWIGKGGRASIRGMHPDTGALIEFDWVVGEGFPGGEQAAIPSGWFSSLQIGKSLKGRIAKTDLNISGDLQPWSGPFSVHAAEYEGMFLMNPMDVLKVYAGTDGTGLIRLDTPRGRLISQVPIRNDGSVELNLPGRIEMNLKLDPERRIVTGTAEYDGFIWDVVGPNEPFLTEGLSNLSVQAKVGPGASLISGFVVEGERPLNLVIRGIGPGLGDLGVSGSLPEPRLELRNQARDLLAANDGWLEDPGNFRLPGIFPAVGAFDLDPVSKDSVLQSMLAGGSYTVEVKPTDGQVGSALIEIYPASHRSSTKLVNLSARSIVGPAGNTILGFAIGGPNPIQLLVRAVGPGLATLGVTEPLLGDPVLSLSNHSDPSESPKGNDNWSDVDEALIRSVSETVGAFPLEPGSADAVVVVWLDPGVYSAKVSDASGGGGVVLTELYVVP